MHKKISNGKIGYFIIIGIILISIFPFLLPFLIFGLIFYFSKLKNIKNLNDLNNNKYFKKFKDNNPDIYKSLTKTLNKYNEKYDNSELSKSIEDYKLTGFDNINYNLKKEEKDFENTFSNLNNKTETIYSDTYSKSKIKYSKPVTKSKIKYSRPDTKSKKSYEYNGGKSIWDDYESVVNKKTK